MYCQYCGNKVEEGSKYCPVCGSPLAEKSDAPKEEKQDTTDFEKTYYAESASPRTGTKPGSARTMAIVSIVLAFFNPLIGLIVSIVAFNNAKRDDPDSLGLAKIGIIVSIVIMAFSLIITVVALVIMLPSMLELMEKTMREATGIILKG